MFVHQNWTWNSFEPPALQKAEALNLFNPFKLTTQVCVPKSNYEPTRTFQNPERISNYKEL